MDHVVSLEQRAVEFARRGDFSADARAVNEELTRVAPQNQGAWTRLARCCMELGLLDEATAALDAALQLNPQNTIAHNLQLEVSKRRLGNVAPVARKRAAAPRTSSSRASSGASTSPRASRTGTVALAGIGRAEFSALGHLQPQAAAESLTARIEPLLMALSERPFAAKVTDARNRAGHAGVRLYRRGSLRGGRQGHVYVYQQGGEWEPQLTIALHAAAQWGRDSISAGIGFNLGAPGTDDRADVGRERAIAYFEAFQRLVSSTWRVHLTEWLRTNGGFIQIGDEPPSTSLLPNDAVASLVTLPNPAAAGWIFVGRWLFADRGEDIGIMTDAPRLVRWLEQTFTDLLPIWGDVYRGAYRS